MAEIICGIYKIINTVTKDFYIGSSKNVKNRWAKHKCPSRWNECPNNPMYLDMQKYGVDKFVFEILEEAEEAEVEQLKEKEQQFIETLKPIYNNNNANGLDIERRKESIRKYNKSDKCKEYHKEYQKSDKYKKYKKEYQNQLCCYNGENLTLNALSLRFKRAGIAYPTKEAKKYLVL